MVILSSCAEKEVREQEKIIAKVNERTLTDAELIAAISPFFDSNDSARLADEYIDDWLTEQLIYAEAEKLLTDTMLISQKLDQYRCQLFVHEYCEKYIYSNVNMSVTEKEISDYYDEHLNDYVINTTYVKAHFMTIPANIVRYYEIFDRVRTSTLDNEQELNDMCYESDKNVYFVKEWIELQDFLKLINYEGTFNSSELKYKNMLDFAHDTLRYLVKIDDFIEPGDLLPLELAKPRIIQIIMSKRKHDKYVQAKDELLNKYKPNVK